MARKVGTTATFKKGQVVKIKGDDIWRKTTEAEMAAWEASDDSKGMTCAGETKLHSGTTYRHGTTGDELFRVVRARVKARRGWHDISGCSEVEDADGVRWFVQRKNLY